MKIEKSKGCLQKVIEREIRLEVPKTASEIKPQSVGANLIEALRTIANRKVITNPK